MSTEKKPSDNKLYNPNMVYYDMIGCVVYLTIWVTFVSSQYSLIHHSIIMNIILLPWLICFSYMYYTHYKVQYVIHNVIDAVHDGYKALIYDTSENSDIDN